MKTLIALVFLAFASCSTVSETPEVQLLYGLRDFDDSSEWEQTDQQEFTGVQVNFAGKNGFGPEVGVLYGRDSSYDGMYVNRPVHSTRTSVREVYAGVRKNFMINDWWQVNLGGGISSIRVETDVNLTYTEGLTRDDTTFSPYAYIGTSAFLNDNVNLGLAYRRNFLDQEADIFINNPELDGGMWILSLGYGF